MAMPLPEQQYLDLVRNILRHGDKRMDRTGVGTLSLFGAMLRFPLHDHQFPVLTTKRVYWKTAVREMLWFLTGGTNIRPLLQNGVRIWTDWPLATYRRETGDDISQEAFETRIVEDPDFARRWGDLGPVYGKQWRRWQDSSGQEHDQIATLVETLKSNPTSRRMLFHAWNVGELDRMALPPCHMVYQFHTTSAGRLNCAIYQRSCDVFLGAPFNFVGGAALTCMLAQQTGLSPGELVWMGADVHLYLNHIEQAETLISRSPRPFPKLMLTGKPDSIDGYDISHFEVSGYDPHPGIRADVAV